jgi:hypothetical protein
MKRTSIILALGALLLSTLACGAGGLAARRNNEIRRAAVAYELSAHGPVDEVLVDYGLTEVRANLGFEDGKTVWLNSFAAGEYFRTRDPKHSYLYLRDLDYADGTATILVERGNAGDVRSYSLALRREGSAWEVVSEESAATPSSPSN